MEELRALHISEQKKQYIIDLLNPVLEEMVAECIHQMPQDPVPFMLQWLENKKVNDEDNSLSLEDKEKLLKENQELQAKIAQATNQFQEAAKMVPKEAEEEEEEEDDEDDEPPPGFLEREQNSNTHARQSVSAEAYGEWNTKKAFVPPVIMKTDEQKERLKSCVCKCFLFSNLDENDLAIVIGAMKEHTAEPGTRLINQGDSGEVMFVIEEGKLDCLIKPADGEEKSVKSCGQGDVVGELALLYNCPRAASVQCVEKCVLWELDRDTFNHIVKEAAQKKRDRYDKVLHSVPLLANMDSYERSQLADALHTETFSDGDVVVNQGDTGTKFFIIEEGEAVATKGGVEVMKYGVGDYFGELALIRNQPRAATVKCKGTSKLLSLNSASFKRLMNVDDLLERAGNYS